MNLLIDLSFVYFALLFRKEARANQKRRCKKPSDTLEGVSEREQNDCRVGTKTRMKENFPF